ncbi:MAG: T9SS type A sorting domain-containing protein [Flavobacteriaceae bacterium]
MYSNPTTGPVQIDLGDNNTAINTTIRDTIGQVIPTQHFENTHNIILDIEAPKGIYFLTLETESGDSKTIKVVKE